MVRTHKVISMPICHLTGVFVQVFIITFAASRKRYEDRMKHKAEQAAFSHAEDRFMVTAA